MTGSTRGEGTGVPTGAGRLTRRTAIGLTYAAALAAVSGCGLRLDLPQPPPPVPTRRRVPDEAVLVELVRTLEGLAAQAGSVTRPGRAARTLGTLAGLFTDQARVLTGRLTNDGVPTDVIHPTPSTQSTPPTGSASGTAGPGTSPAATPSPTASAGPVTLAAFAKGLGEIDAAEWTTAAAVSPGNRSLVLAVHSVRLAGAALLGVEPAFDPQPAPVRPLLVERTAPLVYGFEVVAAHSERSARTRALAVLDEVTDLLHALGGPSTSAPGGWALPFPVTTDKEATRLAQHLLSTAIAATATVTETTPDAGSLAEAARWSARVQATGARWGLPLTAFPGMSA